VNAAGLIIASLLATQPLYYDFMVLPPAIAFFS
jgi:hypothetical protein